MKTKEIENLIDSVYKNIELKLAKFERIKKLKIEYSIDGADNPVIKFELEIYEIN